MKKNLQFLFLMAALLVPWVTQAQLSSATFSTGVDSTRWQTLTTAATQLTFTDYDDGISPVTNMGFSFWFGDIPCSQFSMSTNGLIHFGATQIPNVGYYYADEPFGTSYLSAMVPGLAMLGTDCVIESSSGHYAKYEVLGTAPNRIFVLEVNQAPYAFAGGSYKYQVQLHESSNSLVMLYGSATDIVPSYAIGFAVSDTSVATINTTTHADSITNGATTATASAWPGNGRYYEYVLPTAYSCFPPSGVMAITTSDSAYLSWAGDITTYELEYAVADTTQLVVGDDNNVFLIISNATSVALGNLTPNTLYNYAMRATCSDGTYSPWLYGSFETGCAAIETPYATGFENTDTASAACWKYIAPNGYAGITSEASNTGDYALQLLAATDYGSGSNCYAVLPTVSAPLNTLMLSFYAHEDLYYYMGTLHVGYMTNVSDPNSFVSLTAVATTESWVRYDVAIPTDAQIPYGARLAFANMGGGYGDIFLIDDVQLYPKPTCPGITDLSAITTAGAAMATWSYQTGIIEGSPEGYDVEWALLSDIENRTSLDEIATEPTATITGLSNDSTYMLWVYALCDGERGYGDSITFTTAGLSCLEYTRNDSLFVGDGVREQLSVFPSNWYNRYLQVLYPVTSMTDTGNITSIAFHRVDNATEEVTLVSVDIMLGLTNNSTMSGIITPDSTFEIVYSGSLTLNGDGWITIPFDRPYHYDGSRNLVVTVNSSRSEWGDDAPVRFYCTNTTGNLIAYLQSDTDAPFNTMNPTDGSLSTQAYFPNARFQFQECATMGTCATPAVVVNNITADSVYLSWMPGYQEGEWNVYVKKSSASVWQLAVAATTETSAAIGNLSAGTSYQVRVVSLCDDGDSAYVSAGFFTSCGIIRRTEIPYIADLSANPSNTDYYKLPACWHRVLGYNADITTSVGGRNKAVYIPSISTMGSNETTLITMPEVEMSIDSLEITFDMYKEEASANAMVIVGVMDHPDSLNSFVPIDTVSVSSVGAWQSLSVAFNNYQGNGNYIVFYADSSCIDTASGYNVAYISNIALYLYSECRPVAGIYANAITHESATINVQGADEEGSYRLYYNTINDLSSATSVEFTGSTTTLSDLTYSTAYYVWVVSVCDESESFPRTLSFTTAAPCLKVENIQVQISSANSSAVLSWNAPSQGFDATQYTVKYKEATVTEWTTVTTTDPFYRITGLMTDVVYQYSVTTQCDELVGASNSGTFTVLDNCSMIGSMENSQSFVPYYANYNYSYSQVIYTAGEMAAMGDTIRGLYLYNTNASASTSNTISVYMGNTTTESFATTDATWMPTTTMMQVANNAMVTSAPGWMYIPFDTLFVRNNSQNLVVAFDNNTGSFAWTYPSWASFSTTAPRSKYAFSDDINYNPDSLVGTPTNLSSVPYIRFASDCADSIPCAAPILISSASTESTITVNWFPGTNDSVWSVMYRMEGDETWIPVLTNTPNTTATITGLQTGINYEVRVTNYCSTDDGLYAQGSYSTTCDGILLPYYENFETQPLGDYARSCWQVATTSTSEYDAVMPMVENMSTYSKMLKIGNGGYIVAPSFATAIEDIAVNLTYWASTAENAYIYVGVLEDPTTMATFVPIDTLVVNDMAQRYNTTIRFSNYTEEEGYICFYVPVGVPDSWGNDYIYLDDLTFYAMGTCGTIENLQVVNSTTNTLNVSWTVNGTAPTNYTVEYGVSGFAQGQGTTVTTNTASVILSGLTHSTHYDVYVTPICGAETVSASVLYGVQTECDVMSIPYTMNFDMSYLPPIFETGQMPPCWTVESSMSNAVQITNYPAYATSGTNVLMTELSAVMALPQMNAPLDTLQVSFYADCGMYSNYAVQVGVVDSLAPGFAASFTPVATVNCQGGVRDTVNFCTYEGSGRYIAFRNINPSGSSTYITLFIDDVVVDYRPACLPIYSLSVSNLMMTSLTLNWQSCTENSGYEVRYALAGTETWSNTITTTATTATITGLMMDSTYEFQVRNNCANGETGAWISIIKTMPPCDGYIDAYLFDVDGSSSESSDIPAQSFYKYSFSQVVYDSAMLAQQGLDGVTIDKFAFYPLTVGAFDTAYTNCRLFISTTEKTAFDDDDDFVAVDSADLVYTGDLNWSEIGWREVVLDSAFTWDGHSNLIITFDRNHGVDINGARFLAYSGNENQTIYHYNDNNNLDPFAPTLGTSDYSYGTLSSVPAYRLYGCPSSPCDDAPVVTVDATTATSADISWTSRATNFEVNVKAAADMAWTAADVAVNNAYTYSFTNLQPATQYQYRVRAICGEGSASEWALATFTTDSLPCFAPTNLAAAPSFTTAEMTWTAGGDETAWSIHVWNSTFDQTFAATANPFTVTGLTAGTTYNAAIQAACGGGVLLSDFSDTIEFTTDVCDPVTNVSVDTNGTNAVVTWNAGDNNTGSFAIEYGISGFAAGQGTTVTATANTVTLTDLEEETTYDVYVRAICDDQYNSTWSDVATFTTGATNIGINTVDGNNLVTIYPNPAEQNTTIRVSGVEGDVTMTIVDMNGRTVSTTTMECAGDCEKMMNVDGLAAGSYFVRLQGNGLNAVKKLVIK